MNVRFIANGFTRQLVVDDEFPPSASKRRATTVKALLRANEPAGNTLLTDDISDCSCTDKNIAFDGAMNPKAYVSGRDPVGGESVDTVKTHS